MSNHDIILKKIETYVTNLFRKHHNEAYVYHNIRHTCEVVEAARKISDFFELAGDDYLIPLAAAWFRDTRYLTDPTRHQRASAELAAAFLAAEGVNEQIIQKTKSCIFATRLPHVPENLSETIVCDAVFSHFGMKNFNKRNMLLLKEYNNLHDEPMSKEAWRNGTIELMEVHHYFTDYGFFHLHPVKEKNLRQLRRMASKYPITPGGSR